MGCSTGWISVHLHLRGRLYDAEADRMVLEVAAPLAREAVARGWAERWFFLRYPSGGNHLRLRLRGRRRLLAGEVVPALLERAADPAAEVVQVVWQGYEPEHRRYGGAAGVEVAEALFQASSETAAALLAGLPPEDRSARLGKVLLALLAGLHAFLGEPGGATRLIRDYGSSYLRQLLPRAEQHQAATGVFQNGYRRQAGSLHGFVDAAWAAFEAGEGLPAELAAYHSALGEARERLRALVRARRLEWRDGRPCSSLLQAVGEIVPSYLHMTSNRLGATVTDEAYLAVVAAAALERLAASRAPVPPVLRGGETHAT